jgi:tRNA-specific 2-thiouridylase
MNKVKTSVVVGLSGGVDSATAAALLIDSGYRVIGVTLAMWRVEDEKPEKGINSNEIYSDARLVADHLNIPWYLIDKKNEFYQNVVGYYVESLKQGTTPNPCMICNRIIKWRALLDAADEYGAGYIATGHYARRHISSTVELIKAKDKQKDQTYFLSVLGQKELQRTLFPLGGYTKQEIRKIAEEKKLPVAEREESQDLCFLGGLDQFKFVSRFAPNLFSEGTIEHVDGRKLGKHQGLAFFTIGQRKGISIAFPYPLYVIQKDIHNNRLIVGEKQLLGNNRLTAGGVNWVSGEAPGEEFYAQARIRYRSAEKECLIKTRSVGRIDVQFSHDLRDITAGQALVMYKGDNCLGMGFIE